MLNRRETQKCVMVDLMSSHNAVFNFQLGSTLRNQLDYLECPEELTTFASVKQAEINCFCLNQTNAGSAIRTWHGQMAVATPCQLPISVQQLGLTKQQLPLALPSDGLLAIDRSRVSRKESKVLDTGNS